MADGRRSFADGVLTSTDVPALRLRVEPQLRYLGVRELAVAGIAHAERHHFVATQRTALSQLLVVQFEGFLPTSDEVYRYRLPNPVSLGDTTWGTWLSASSIAAEIAEAPDAELADTAAFLAAEGIQVDDELLTARYAQIVGEDARHEVLIFYSEPLVRLGHTLRTLIDGGEIKPVFASVGVEFQARASRAFRLEPLTL